MTEVLRLSIFADKFDTIRTKLNKRHRAFVQIEDTLIHRAATLMLLTRLYS
eukprot:m.19424 g.19424  ORF g.19424 m.19424 type:complete len:51 (-) comp10901_c0_seq1:91-243(-)